MNSNVIEFKQKETVNPEYNRNFFTNLSTIVNNNYLQYKHSSIAEKTLKKEFDRIISLAKESKWLTGKELEIYLKYIEKIMMEDSENEINTAFKIMIYTSLIDKRKESLYDKYNITDDIVDAFNESEIPYTNYKIYADILYSDDFNANFDKNKSDQPAFRRIQNIIDDVELKKEEDFNRNLKRVLDYMKDEEVVIVYEKDFNTIYNYLFYQMIRFNEIVPNLFKEDYFTRLNKIKKLYHLDENMQKEMLDKLLLIHENANNIKDEIISTLALIDLIIETKLVEDNIIRPTFGK